MVLISKSPPLKPNMQSPLEMKPNFKKMKINLHNYIRSNDILIQLRYLVCILIDMLSIEIYYLN